MGAAQIEVAWADVSGEAGYRIEQLNGSAYESVGTVAAGVTSYAISGLPHGTSQTFRVIAYNDGGDSAPSATASATTSLPAPSGPSAAAPGAGVVNVSWQDNAIGEDGYVLEWSTDGGATYPNTVTLDPNSTTWSLTGVAAGATVAARVKAVKGSVQSDYAPPASAAVTDGTVVYSNGFDSGAAGFTPTTTSAREDVTADNYVGPFYGPSKASLSLSGLPEHALLRVSFKLFVLNTWEGDADGNRFQVTVRDSTYGRALMDQTFSNTDGDTQSYPSAGSPARAAADPDYASIDNDTDASSCCCSAPASDAVYNLSYTFPHAGSSVDLDFEAVGIEDQEGWGIGDVQVSVERPTISVTADQSQYKEGDTAAFTLARSGPTGAPLTVSYTTAGTAERGNPTGGDYDAGTGFGTITFGPTEATRNVTFPVRRDPEIEAPETLKLVPLSRAGSQGGSSASASLTDDLRITIGTVPLTVGLTADLPVVVTKADGTEPGEPVTLTVSDADGTVVVPRVQSITTDEHGRGALPVFANGEGRGRVALKDDKGAEGLAAPAAVAPQIVDATTNKAFANFEMYDGQTRVLKFKVLDANGAVLKKDKITSAVIGTLGEAPGARWGIVPAAVDEDGTWACPAVAEESGTATLTVAGTRRAERAGWSRVSPACAKRWRPGAAGGPPPPLAAGRVTFGCLNKLVKVTPAMMRAWAQVLRAVPGSRLLVLAAAGAEGPGAAQVRGRFAAEGVPPERLVLTGRLPRGGYLGLYNRVDAALDTFPYNGHTTTLDGLWMGVPAVTLAGDSHLTREGLAVLRQVRLSR
jgi:hypothetical protein